MRFTDMASASSLLVDEPNSEQLVRRPEPGDAVGALLQRIYVVRRQIPDPLARLLSQIEAAAITRNPVNDPR